MHTSTGKLVYDPTIANKTKTRADPYWLILECDGEICRYYRHMAQKAIYIDMLRPAWGAHISIIRGEVPAKPDLWRKYAGKIISFNYGETVRSNHIHFWLDVDCPVLLDIRDELGLPRNPVFGQLHLTIGNRDVDMSRVTNLKREEIELADELERCIGAGQGKSEEASILRFKLRRVREKLNREAKNVRTETAS